MKIVKAQRPSPANRDQRKHLLGRIECRHREIEQALQEVGAGERNRWGQWEPEVPENIKAARALIAAYEQQIDDEWAKQRAAVDRLRRWLREQVLFLPAVAGLQLLKSYESMSAEQALAAGTSMEDRNDMPLGLPGITPVIEIGL